MLRKEDTLLLTAETADALDDAIKEHNSQGAAAPRQPLEPSLRLDLSQNTMQQIIEDARHTSFGAGLFQGMDSVLNNSGGGPEVASLHRPGLSTDAVTSSSAPRRAASFFSAVDGQQAEANNQAEHCFSIETETLVLPACHKDGNSVTLSEIASFMRLPCSQENQVTNDDHASVSCPPDSHFTAITTDELNSPPLLINNHFEPTASSSLKGEPTSHAANSHGQFASDFPSNTPYPGPHNLQVFFSKALEHESKKTIAYRFVAEENKLYVRTNVGCPVHFKLDSEPPEGSIIRAMAIYSRPQDMSDVVKRCMNHTTQDKDKMDHSDHFVRCTNPTAVYEEFGVGDRIRQSVCIPWSLNDVDANGSDFVSALYSFMCFNSCVGTINRRPLQLLFTLEHCRRVLGRQCVELKVCACPGRDADLPNGGPANRRKGIVKADPPKQTDFEQRLVSSNFTTIEPAPSRRTDQAQTGDRDNHIYNVQIRGRELYKIVMTIVRNYEISRHYETMAEDEDLCEDRVKINNNASNAAVKGNITPDTPVSKWLQTLGMDRYRTVFERHQLLTLDDLNGRMVVEYLRQLGLTPEDATSLQIAYVQWRSVYDATRLSSLESVPPAGDSPNDGEPLVAGDGSSGVRVSKTTVRHVYKVPAKKRRLPQD